MSGKARKRVLLMLPMLHQGGFERVAVATARLLAEDYDIALCIFSDKNIHYDVTGLRIINLDVPSEKSRVKKVRNVLRRVCLAKQVKRDFDLCYSFGSTANLVNALARTWNCRTVIGMRCGTDLDNRSLLIQTSKYAHLVISCSKELDRLVRQMTHRESTRYLYNPLDGDAIRAEAAERTVVREPGTFSIVTMGRDDYIKAHWHMIKAFSLVVQRHPEARLKIIGAGKYTQYRELAQKLGVLDRITFTGALKNPFPEVASADLYVLPSNHEGFPNALVEAMALGRPVIATDCRSGPREILLSGEELDRLLVSAPYGVSTPETIEGSYGILIPDMSAVINTDPSDIEAGERILAEEITKMIEDGGRRAHYAERARLKAEAYTPENYRLDLEEILEEVLKGGGMSGTGGQF